MINKLELILQQKKREVAALYARLQDDPNHPIAQLLSGEQQASRPAAFKDALKSSSLAVIAEIKRKSPSKGALAAIQNPIELAHQYIAGGTNALSILTDKTFFDGQLEDLIQVASIAHPQAIPMLRKDFIIDRVQIAEARVAGASAILLIVAALGKQTQTLLEFAHSIDLDVLVEVHDHTELELALDCGADIVGVNNRNLKTLQVDTQCALQIISAIPDHLIKIAESGIRDPATAREYYQAGFDAVLIGEALVKSAHPEQFIKACQHG